MRKWHYQQGIDTTQFMPFAGLRVLSLETRKASEIESMIVKEGGVPFVAPSVKERSVENRDVALGFVEKLEAGAFDMLICMTGAGLAFLRDLAAPEIDSERLASALRKVTIVSRGPKPLTILHPMGVRAQVVIPEPNTWREIVTAVSARPERRIAVQEYGRPNKEMNTALEAMGAAVTPIAVYRWVLPDDLEPLREAARRIANRSCDVVLFTSSIQLDHLLEIAETLGIREDVRKALAADVVTVSIGPVMTDAMNAHGIPPDIEPRHPKMWALIKAAAEESAQALTRKRPGGQVGQALSPAS